MIDLARRRVAGLDTASTRCELVTGDFLEHRTSEVFDLVIAQGVFDYVSDPLPFLQRMKERARHSVVASFPSISIYRTPIRKLRYRIKNCPVYFYDRAAIDRLAGSAGFSRHEIHKIKGAGQDYFVAFFV